MKPKNNKPIVGENLLYFMVWAMAILVPILNSKMMSEEHVYLVNILTAWSKLLPYFIVFLLNNTDEPRSPTSRGIGTRCWEYFCSAPTAA